MSMFVTRKTDKTASRSATGGFLGRFWADQSGAAMSYLAIFGSLVMMIFGGIGIDMMHAELKRNKVQHTLDRAVLAAANLNHNRDPDAVVEDYFRAMNMLDALDGVQVNPTASGGRAVTAYGKDNINSHFMALVGVDTMDVYGMATAENAVAPTEISLVLDISGSMQGDKIAQLKVAAKDFIDTVLGDGGDNSSVTVSVIPYNATVNMGPELAARYNLQRSHDYSTCATFSGNDYLTTSLSRNQPLEQIAHFDPYAETQVNVDSPWCATGDTANIIAHSADPAYLKAFIDSLEAEGNTAIDLGMKWGLALLDPSANSVVSELVDAGLSPASATFRPTSYDSATQKYVVVMTDGENTEQFDLRSYMKDPNAMSNVWVDDHGTPGRGDDRYSIRVVDRWGDWNDVWYWPHAKGRTPRYNSGPYSWVEKGAARMINGIATVGGENENGKANCSSYKGAGANAAQPTLTEELLGLDLGAVLNPSDCRNYPPVRLTWQELYGNVKTSYYANRWYWQAYLDGKVSYQDYQNAYYAWETIVDGATADTRLGAICSAAKTQGVVIYTIGVEAPERGLQAMSSCASSPAHFFDVQGSQLTDTFKSISDMLVSLRLTE